MLWHLLLGGDAGDLEPPPSPGERCKAGSRVSCPHSPAFKEEAGRVPLLPGSSLRYSLLVLNIFSKC